MRRARGGGGDAGLRLRPTTFRASLVRRADAALSPLACAQGLADYQAKLMNAKDDYEKAAAQVGIEVCSAMNSALGG